jgi:predicted ATP-dependent serine protease
MTHVAYFCGCCYSFVGDVGVCPRCGEYTTFTTVTPDEEHQMRDELRLLLDDVAASKPEP